MAFPERWLTDVTSHSKVRALARRALAARLDRVWRNLRRAAQASLKQVEDIHRLRTSSRRAAAAVELFRPLLPRKGARWFEKQLKKIRRAAGDVRDLDVMLEQISEAGSSLSKEKSDLLDKLAKRRQDAQQPLRKLQRDLGKKHHFARKQERLLNDLEKPVPAMDQDRPPRLREWGTCRLIPQARAFLALGKKRLSTIEAAHGFRITAKELRYVIEIVGGALPTAAVRIYALLGELQQKIGVICDHAAAERMYGELMSKSGKSNRKHLRSQIAAEKKQRVATHKVFLRWWTARRRDVLEKAFAKAGLLNELSR